MPGKEYDLFVSYNRTDRALVGSIAERLRRARVRVWYDDWEMKPGDSLRERISDGIENASFFIAVLSPAALSSSWGKV